MKKNIVVLVVAALLVGAGWGTASWAKEMAGPRDMEKMGTHPMKYGMGMMGMMNKSMVASNDGGVIVLAGNKLMKYDKDLNLVKEVELNMGMMKDCPMMKGKMMESDMGMGDMKMKAEDKK